MRVENINVAWEFHRARLWYWMFTVEIQGELKEKDRGRVEKNEHSYMQKQSYLHMYNAYVYISNPNVYKCRYLHEHKDVSRTFQILL